MQLNVSYVLELLNIIEKQNTLLEQKDKLITQLITDNLEKENLIEIISVSSKRA